MEYYLLTSPICEKCPVGMQRNEKKPHQSNSVAFSSKEVHCTVLLSLNTQQNIKPAIRQLQEQAPKAVLEQPKILITRLSRKRMRYMPLNSTARRTLTFEHFKGPDFHSSANGKVRQIAQLTPLEFGDQGCLTEIASVTLQKWLNFGTTLQAPSVRLNTVTLANRHLLNVPIKELQKLITQLSQDTTKVFRSVPTDNHSKAIYVPYNSAQTNIKCIIISRNFEQWKAFMTLKDGSKLADIISSPNLKHIQKFAPLITTDNKFVPRQKILWAFVQSGSITILTYNWSKDNIDKLIDQGTNIGMWLSVRAGVLNSVIAQKLGLFYNQAAARTTLVSRCFS